MRHLLSTVTVFAGFSLSLSAQEISFAEDFALAKDRAKALQSLIPGTEDHFFYTCLHRLNSQEYDRAAELFSPWLKQHGQTPRLTELQFRHALLTHDRDPAKAYDFLIRQYGFTYNHQRQVTGGSPNLPTSLDSKLIDRLTLHQRSLAERNLVNPYEDSALDWLANEPTIDRDFRRNLLSRFKRPDHPLLVKLIAADLADRDPVPFGSIGIHNNLTTAQLDELQKLRPELANLSQFVSLRLIRLQPGADENWRVDPKKTLAYFERLEAYVRTLAPVHNGLKAHVLFQRLSLDRSQGQYDKQRFLDYLALPRGQGYMAVKLLESVEQQRFPASLDADYGPQTLLPPVRVDEPLVRDYLKHFFIEADSTREFEPYILSNYLRRLFAETKIERGLGEPEKWAAQLSPAEYAELKDRIDIDFLPTNPTQFGADDDVKLTLAIKNVPTLIVNVFEINTAAYYQANKKPIETNLNLDGLVANARKVESSTDAPVRRTERTFSFPELKKPGVYIVDFIGSGKSSRALVRKGLLRPLVRTSSAGHALTVVNESNQRVPTATIWLNGTEYSPDKDGTIRIPFSSSPGRQPIVVRNGDFACIDYLDLQGEQYSLSAGIHVDREALLSQRLATVAVRPGLFLNGKPVTLSAIEEPKLTLIATDRDGVATTSEIRIEKLFEDRESTHTFRVPPRLATLVIRFDANVKSLITLQTVNLTASESISLNGIAATDRIEDIHLARFGNSYALELLGRTGEIKPDRAVNLSLKHRDFRQPVNISLKTDAKGRVTLGELIDIVAVTATCPDGQTSHSWSLPLDRCTYRQVVHVKSGDAVTLPYAGSAKEPSRSEFALFRVIGSSIIDDLYSSIKVVPGAVEIPGLTPGDYDFALKRTGETIRIRVVEGPLQNGYLLGSLRHLEVNPLTPVRIAAITPSDDNLVIKLADATKYARVHVFASRYTPGDAAFKRFARIRDGELRGVMPGSNESSYLTGRNIGDEYRYVLDRRLQKPFAGNMLERPQLLLNPWAIRPTESGEQVAQGGEAFGTTGAPKSAAPLTSPEAKMEAGARGGQPMPPGAFDELDFLAEPTVTLLNLIPEADGTLTIRRAAFGSKAWVTVVAVDPLHTVVKTVGLPEGRAGTLDLRLTNGLDPAGHFTQQKRVSLLEAGKAFVIKDAAGSRFEAFDSLARLHALYSTLTKDPRLSEFAFILKWPTFKSEEKKSLYSKHACHELTFFIFHKDRPFFDEVIKPYLANKKEKTFLDHYLLGNDLKPFAKPWEYHRLNAVEKILLGRVLPDEAARTARYLADLQRLVPPNPTQDQMLFEFAVKGSDLRVENLLSLNPPTFGKPGEAGGGNLGGGGGGFAGGGLGAAPGGSGGMGSPPPAPPVAAAMPGMPSGGGRPSRAAKGAMESKAKDGAMRRDAEALGRELADKKNADETLKGDALGEKEGRYFADDRKRLAESMLYRKVDPTSEWAENNYDKRRIQEQLANVVVGNPFWIDYANFKGDGPFLSTNINRAGNSFTEAMFALAVTGLPFEAAKHDTKFEGGGMTLTPGGPMIAFHEEVTPTGEAKATLPILVTQNVYKHGDRYRDENGERLDKFVTDEFVAHTVYGMQVVVTNPSPSRQRLAVLVQIPIGAIPLANARPTKSILLDLEPYRTGTADVLFYFPLPGDYKHFPVHVSRNEQLVASAKPMTFRVVATATKADTTSWDYVSQSGTLDDVIAYLGRDNVHALNLERIAWRMGDVEAFDRITTALAARHVYHPTLWSYALKHRRPEPAADLLKHLKPAVGGPLTSPLYVFDPVATHDFEHLEYRPLVNARAHTLGKRRQIVNQAVAQHYQRFLNLLGYKATLSDDDKLAAAYHLLLQDRVDEAGALFAEVNVDRIATRLQYDAFASYLAMSREEFAAARAIAIRHVNHPIDRWKKTFQTVIDVLDEAEGKGAQVADAEDRRLAQAKAAANVPSFTMTVEKQTIDLSYQNLDAVTVNYYPMDVELLFSRNPFVRQTVGDSVTIRPHKSMVVKLDATKAKQTIALPDEFKSKNVLVEVVAAGKRQSLPSYANAMTVTVIEAFGQVKVVNTATGKPLAKVYVKTYVRTQNGQIKFHKDGYTDVRGRFDYATVSTPERNGPAAFSVLVLSDDYGAVIREAAPPQP